LAVYLGEEPAVVGGKGLGGVREWREEPVQDVERKRYRQRKIEGIENNYSAHHKQNWDGLQKRCPYTF
jgi:hypothetical protein